MNKELFDSMRKQMTPSPEVRAALSEKLAQPMKKRPVPWKKYGAVAACAALVIGAFSVYSLCQNPDEWMVYVRALNRDSIDDTWVPLHSYVTVEGLTEYTTNLAVNDVGGSVEEGVSTGASRDQNMDMTVYDLEEAMLDVGYTVEEVKEYETTGYQMTWAKWWKFVHQQQNSEGDDPFNLADLKTFSQKELSVNTGVLPGGAYIGDAPSQEEAINAYQKLMGHFTFGYPNWYGGAYIDDSATLVVLLVSSEDPGDKTLELRVLDWTDNGRVAFSSAKYSLRYLLGLQDKVVDAMQELGLFSGCGTYESDNQLHLTLTGVTDEALAILARLDPEDDAIYVEVGQLATADVGTEDPAVHHAITPGGTTVPVVPEDDENLIAVEPYYDGAHYDLEHLPEELPEKKQPAITVQSASEDTSAARNDLDR